MKRTEKDIYMLIDQATERLRHGELYTGMSYEEGVKDALEWVLGGEDRPLE